VVYACDPQTYLDACGNTKMDTTMAKEYNFIMKNNTWELVPCPEGKNVVKCIWDAYGCTRTSSLQMVLWRDTRLNW
jgi:hypothetical protein